jgi:succinate dehydrogenase / fumarate reductase iron-sulfur subunit
LNDLRVGHERGDDRDAGGTTEPAGETRRVRVFRFKRGDERPHHDTFQVPVAERTTVLDALRWIQLHRDRTLALRHSCFHASCGTCGVRVNDREVLACVTRMRDLGGEIVVDPIANIPVLTDLVVDMREFYARFPDEHPLVRTSEFLEEAETPANVERYQRYEDCIECGLCVSACPVVVTAERYVGPAALAWGERVVEEPRGAEIANLLSWADQPDGVWRCHAIFECTEACPSGVNPAARIMSLRGTLLGGKLREQRRKAVTR